MRVSACMYVGLPSSPPGVCSLCAYPSPQCRGLQYQAQVPASCRQCAFCVIFVSREWVCLHAVLFEHAQPLVPFSSGSPGPGTCACEYFLACSDPCQLSHGCGLPGAALSPALLRVKYSSYITSGAFDMQPMKTWGRWADSLPPAL